MYFYPWQLQFWPLPYPTSTAQNLTLLFIVLVVTVATGDLMTTQRFSCRKSAKLQNTFFFGLSKAIFKPVLGLALPRLTEDPPFWGVYHIYPIHKPMIRAIQQTWAGPPCGFLRLEGAVGMVAERDIQVPSCCAFRLSKRGMVARQVLLSKENYHAAVVPKSPSSVI